VNRVANQTVGFAGNGEVSRVRGGLPHSSDAEMGVLGSMLQDRSALVEALERLRPEHFFIPANRSTFIALGAFYHQEKKRALDLITFTQSFTDGIRIRQDPNDPGYMLRIEEAGGVSYVTNLFTFVPTAANVDYYLDIVREKYVAREIIAKCTEIIRVARNEQAEIAQVLEQTQAALTQIIIETERPDVIVHVREGVPVAVEQLAQAYAHRGEEAVVGLATGIIDLDRMTAGLREQQLVIVGARPSQGKTALAMNFASNMAVLNQVPVGVFSMEMSYQEVVNRLFSNVTNISLQRFRDGKLDRETADDLKRFREAFSEAEGFENVPERMRKIIFAPLWIDDSGALSIASFKARARLMRTRYGVKAIVVDYLQLMHSGSKRSQEARWLEITEISASLKATAKELGIPIICCAQLNREAEGREFGKPKLSDLRESGSIEQDADIVLLLWRPSRHIQHPLNEGIKGEKNKLAKLLHLKSSSDGTKLWEESKRKKQELLESEKEERLTEEQIAERTRQIEEYAELILAKQRNGPVNNIRLRFVDELTRFENVTKKTWSNNPQERQQNYE
jgi:replicative DNA helicase